MPDSPGSRAWDAQPIRQGAGRGRVSPSGGGRVRLRPTEDVNDANARLWQLVAVVWRRALGVAVIVALVGASCTTTTPTRCPSA
jgi:hypothetical protein